MENAIHWTPFGLSRNPFPFVGEGMRDEPLRTFAWEATKKVDSSLLVGLH